ncbi:electron transfer DM13 [Saccharothrix saharensis]|uniref:Electron transfer DM13 n=1 Tax=Saccharothrix saharensis TaxID=571190 RepID=A0A543JLF9_9PSEU|nr:DM13 domain-containing protein [Saccharothrix saharensis]TQM83686.1 electron transfer DM13 [Saccharothrix saharensis]
MSKRVVVVGVAGVLVVALVVGLYLFQPWRLVTDRTADEALLVPTATTTAATTTAATTTAATTTAATATTTTTTTPPPPAGPVALAAGPFRSLEHATTGSATLVRLPGGGHAVQFEALDTSDGPDLYVYLSDKPSDSPEAAFGSGFTNLGPLKANRGNQVYEVPAGTDLATVRSVVIWCKRFSAGFAVAPLEQG